MIDPCILAIDPGASGAIAFYFPAVPNRVSVEDVPVAGGEVDCAALARRIAQLRPTLAIIERVGAMPAQGVSSTFKFGCAYGMARGVTLALGVPTHLVSPVVWKRHFSLDSDKEKARALAIRTWPEVPHFERKKDHGRAEAALMAKYGAEVVMVARAAA